MKEIQLTQGKVAIVDDEDYEWLSKSNWIQNSKGYINRYASIGHQKQRCEKMHRIILGIKNHDTVKVDHINGIKHDNRKSNLRICYHSENLMNRGVKSNNKAGIKVIGFHKIHKKWYARITVNKKLIFLGNFKSKEMAFEAYCNAAIKYHGEFANFGNGLVILGGDNAKG